jgi:hypothetical protein
VALRADVSKTFISWAEKFSSTHIWKTAALKTDAVQQCTCIEACCYISEGLTNAFTSNKFDDS